MFSNKIIGRYFSSDTLATKKENGDWEVKTSMIEKRLLEGADGWEERVIESSATDPNFESAYGVAMDATLRKFNEALKDNSGSGLFKDDEADEESTAKVFVKEA